MKPMEASVVCPRQHAGCRNRGGTHLVPDKSTGFHAPAHRPAGKAIQAGQHPRDIVARLPVQPGLPAGIALGKSRPGVIRHERQLHCPERLQELRKNSARRLRCSAQARADSLPVPAPSPASVASALSPRLASAPTD